jgi:hypothetical protein
LTLDKRQGTYLCNASETKTGKRTTESFEILRETERQKSMVGGAENSKASLLCDVSKRQTRSRKNKVPALGRTTDKSTERTRCQEVARFFSMSSICNKYTGRPSSTRCLALLGSLKKLHTAEVVLLLEERRTACGTRTQADWLLPDNDSCGLLCDCCKRSDLHVHE